MSEEVLEEQQKDECTKKEKDCKHKDKVIKELEEKLASKEKELADVLNKSSQILATASYYKNELDSQKKDFERYKERNKNLEEELKIKANEDIAKKILPIIDNFDQAISHTDESVMKGFEMIYKSLLDLLEGLGVEEVEAEGELNPEFHNCITTEPTEDDELDGKIASVYQKGYKFKATNKAIRVATVSVYKK